MKYALVTGSTKGIGKQVAVELLNRGCYVILNYSSSDDTAKAVQKELATISNQFQIIKADLSTNDGLQHLVEGTRNIIGPAGLDYIILNTGITDRSSFTDITVDAWNKVLMTNLTNPLFLCQQLDTDMNSNGRIVCIGSILGIVPHSVSISYGVSKAGVHMMAKYLAKHFADKNITVNVIAPGFVDTEWHTGKSPERRAKIEQKISLKRFASTQEVAMACMHMLDNAYITGQVIVVDGGYNLD
jgi:3-oxoacyl-[acyl-carrier protein] reductase